MSVRNIAGARKGALVIATAAAAGLALAACSPGEEPSDATGTNPATLSGGVVNGNEVHGGEHLVAPLTLADGKSAGSVDFAVTPAIGDSSAESIAVTIKVEGLSQGLHEVHIHQVGKCEGDFSSAGEHIKSGNKETGELAGVTVLKDRHGESTSSFDTASVDDIVGRAVVVHEVGSEKRVACGVISLG